MGNLLLKSSRISVQGVAGPPKNMGKSQVSRIQMTRTIAIMIHTRRIRAA
jgi:hypothetical protein